MASVVLVVDDERDNRELLEIILSSSGFRVLTASSGEEALERIAELPDLVLLDLMMPGMSGYDVVRSIKSNAATATIPVVMVTALDGRERKLALEAGAEGFLTKPLDRAECARSVGLDPLAKTILLMGGGAGLGSLDTVAERLLALEANFQLIVLAGKNAQALSALQALAKRYPGRLVAQGFTDQVERLMACADLVITKPGGLTTSECLAMGLPMIVNAPIPGQEERNADFLLEQGVALKAFDSVTLEYRVQYLLHHPAKLADMREKALALGRPHAARQVLARVLGLRET